MDRRDRDRYDRNDYTQDYSRYRDYDRSDKLAPAVYREKTSATAKV